MGKCEKVSNLCNGSLKKEHSKITAGLMVLVLTWLFVASWTFSPQIIQAEVEWKIIKELDLKTNPIDIAASMDGKWLFILTPGEIIIFSIPEGTIADRIPVDKSFDRIAPLTRPDLLTLTSNTKEALQVIWFEMIAKIDLTGLPFKGPQDASVTVAVFEDYQCSYCAGLEPIFRQVLEKYPKDVKLVVKHFPIAGHDYARKAAIAALAGGKQNKFWEAHEKLFANQNDLNDSKVEAIAGEIGLDMEQFHKDLKDPAIASLIDRDLKDGHRAIIPGTPAVFVNGRLLKQRSPQGFEQAIEAELKKKK